MKVLLSTLITITLFLQFNSMKWLPAVSGYDTNDSNNGFAGVYGKIIQAIRVSGGYPYRVHTNGRWLPAVTGNSASDANNGYAGIEGKPIDAVAIDRAKYQVHIKGGKWLPPVDGYNINDSNNGYAGVIGKPIDAIAIQGRTYAVAYGGESPQPDPEPVTPIDPSGEQVFVNYGTGVRDIPYQAQIEHMKEGCLFMACCVKGGLGTKAHILDAYYWALAHEYIRSDCYVNMGSDALAKKISEHYGTYYHPDFEVVRGRGHFYLYKNGKEIFNSAGFGWGH